MKHTALIVLALALAAASPLAAGVVYEIEVTDHDASPPTVETTEVSVEGKNLKMGISSGSTGGGPGIAIFRGDRREMIVVDHDDKSYMVIDEAAIQSIAGQVSQAMKQVEEALENVPEDQRAMVEKMMKERMPQQAPSRPRSEVRKSGERATRNGYPAVRYDVLTGGEKTLELWVTDWSNVEGGDDAAEAFAAMGEFFSAMMDAIGSAVGAAGGGPLAGSGTNVFEHLADIDGFPVVTRELEGGELESESSLRSASRRTLDPADFEPPAGYKRRSMMGGQ